ncbi:MAG: hypothetical protein AAF694_21725 [Bacteroidota bacterium]
MKLFFITLFLLHAICMQIMALFGGVWGHFFLSNASKVFKYDTSKHPITSLLQTKHEQIFLSYRSYKLIGHLLD